MYLKLCICLLLLFTRSMLKTPNSCGDAPRLTIRTQVFSWQKDSRKIAKLLPSDQSTSFAWLYDLVITCHKCINGASAYHPVLFSSATFCCTRISSYLIFFNCTAHCYNCVFVCCRYAITLGSLGDFLGTQEKIKNGYTFKVRSAPVKYVSETCLMKT